MLRRSRIAPTVLLAIVALSGCTAQPPAELSEPSEPPATIAPATAATAAASAYTCDDIATLDNVAAVFVTADGTVPTPVVATQPAMTLTDHRLVDADIALTSLNGPDPDALLGVSGGQQRFHSTLSELVASPFQGLGPGPVDYSARATGPTSTRQVVAFGLRRLHFDGQPLAVLQRAANPQFGRNTAELEIMAVAPEIVNAFLAHLRELMIEHSVLRRQVLSFVQTEYGSGAGITFLERPLVPAAAIVLPEGILGTISDHVIGIGEQRQALLAAGQHLKRGVLLYGPPGTGKTLTVRHLLSETPGITAVLLTGSSIVHIAAAAEIARTFAPSIVVLEDIDLVAMQRHATPQPLLFEVLDALDGLDGDADAAFVMTTNRVEVLERALAERPGRADLAVEVPLPALAERERLFRRYAGALSTGAAPTRRLLGTSSIETGRWQPDQEPGDGPNDGSYVPLHGAGAVMTRQFASFRVSGSTPPVTVKPPADAPGASDHTDETQ
ncbi:ATP-binding protein [Cryobacterium sp. TMS1-13-1]|uniref:AAA family ATPase n=1 Tax=Cryobacterium sp. TMS1-13-1 TaxID=1259220 RepID=UPI001F541CC9|nr:ATP-binding protein [Cryobacterium sp. TMS1-13-1]